MRLVKIRSLCKTNQVDVTLSITRLTRMQWTGAGRHLHMVMGVGITFGVVVHSWTGVGRHLLMVMGVGITFGVVVRSWHCLIVQHHLTLPA